MTTKKMDAVTGRRFLPSVPVLGLLGLALGASHCAAEPQDVCAVPSGEAIALFTPTNMPSAACMSAMTLIAPSLAGTTPKGEAFGIENYVGLNPNDPNAPNTPGSFAIKSETIGQRIVDAQTNGMPSMPSYPYSDANSVEKPPPEDTSTNHPYAWGKFDSVYPDANNICHVSKVIGSNMTYPAYMSMGTGQPAMPMMVAATQIDYEWSNVKVYVKAPIIGSRIDADLTITEDMCSQSYHVNILFPRVQCAQLDANNMPTDNPNPSACSPVPNPVPNPKQSDLYGSGIAPGIDVSCQDIGVNMPGMHDWECLPNHPL